MTFPQTRILGHTKTTTNTFAFSEDVYGESKFAEPGDGEKPTAFPKVYMQRKCFMGRLPLVIRLTVEVLKWAPRIPKNPGGDWAENEPERVVDAAEPSSEDLPTEDLPTEELPTEELPP